MIPNIAIISNSQTPYRLHLHRRIVAALPQIKLHSVFTHEISNSSWKYQAPPEIGPVLFGKGETCEDQDKPSRVFREWRRGGRIIRWMKQNQIRFVVMMGYNDAGRLRMIRWCRRNSIPCFLFGDSNIHGDNPSGIKAVLKKTLVGWVMRNCTGAFACGSLGKQYFMKYGTPANRVFYYPYEPDYDLIRNLPQQQLTAVKSKFGLADGRRRLVYSGRLMSHKRVDLLFKAFLSVCKERPAWDLVVVGNGPDADKLKAMIPPDLTSRFVWTGFVDDQSIVSAIYRVSDVLVLPSDFEPWALVVNEAAAAGMAIISSSVVGAAAELVRDQVNGKLFPPGDLSALTHAILDVTDPSQIDRLKQGSSVVLADWQKRGDPVQGLLAAMQLVQVV